MFVAARLLEEPGRTVESVALQLAFDSPSGLRNTLRRYTGRPPVALRAAGGLRCALGAFAAACEARRAAGQGGGRRAPGPAPTPDPVIPPPVPPPVPPPAPPPVPPDTDPDAEREAA